MIGDNFTSGAVLAIGASGTVGRELLQELRPREQRIRAAAREPLAASRCIDPETDWILFDYQREETFANQRPSVIQVVGSGRVFVMPQCVMDATGQRLPHDCHQLSQYGRFIGR